VNAQAISTEALEALLRVRHSCRAFRPDPVPRATIDRILGLAQMTPSWCNTQPWRVIVTTGEETQSVRQVLQEAVTGSDQGPDIAFPERYEGVARERRRHCAWQLYDSVGVTWGDRQASGRQTMENFALFGAPHLAIVTTDAHLGPYGGTDCGLFLQTFMLAAASLGVATIAQAAIASCAPALRQRYNIPGDRHVLCGISFGYEDPNHPANAFRTERADTQEVVSFVD
jgi:nitroreductase